MTHNNHAEIELTDISDSDNIETGIIDNSNSNQNNTDPLGFFGRYLTIWVALCMIIGTIIGASAPEIANVLDKVTVYHINMIVAILLWIIMFPMMIQIDWHSLVHVKDHPRAIFVCTFLNWAIQPFLTYAFALLFFRVIFGNLIETQKQDEFIAGSVILGGSPCTAMVFVWSALAGGHAGYTLVQVVVNDLIILILYTPTIILLIGGTGISIPYDVVCISVVLFVVIPFAGTYIYRKYLINKLGLEQAQIKIKHITDYSGKYTIISLLSILVLIFIFQGDKIYHHPIDILYNIIPLVLVAFIIFGLGFFMCYKLHIPYKFAAPACFIATSNFFELAVAVALSAYGLDSGAVLTTVVGVLVEVPVMLLFVKIMLKYKNWWIQYNG
jgi:ACR3 family arsenite transporter